MSLIPCSSSVPTSIPSPQAAGSTARSASGPALPSLKGLLRDRSARSRSVAVVDWADEEGARFGRSLYGSSAFVGALEVDELAGLLDRDGQSAAEVLGAGGYRHSTHFEGADPRLERIAAYLELHIEQGPILEKAREPVASVTGTVGISRDCISFEGQSAHAGPTPMEGRADALLAAAEVAVALEDLARRSGGSATNGRLDLEPGVPTATAGRADLFTDLRHEDAEALERMHVEAGRIAESRASLPRDRGEETERSGPSSRGPSICGWSRPRARPASPQAAATSRCPAVHCTMRANWRLWSLPR